MNRGLLFWDHLKVVLNLYRRTNQVEVLADLVVDLAHGCREVLARACDGSEFTLDFVVAEVVQTTHVVIDHCGSEHDFDDFVLLCT